MESILAVLPRFEVVALEETDKGEVVLRGKLDEPSKAPTEGWLWLWDSIEVAYATTILSNSHTTGDAVLRLSRSELPDHTRSGDFFYWIGPGWQAYHVDMILERSWASARFESGDAVHFEIGGRPGWRPADSSPLPREKSRELRVGGWDHEHCEICTTRIGVGGEPTGFVDPKERWLCSSCHGKWAVPCDLRFLLS